MKIRIEMTAEELNKGSELVAGILPGIDISSYVPANHQQVETKCDIFEIDNIVDPETGVISEIEIKTHFIMWMLRKMKPFIATFVTLWHMFTDFCEDIQLMMGDITVLHNGENLSDKLSKMVEESDYNCTNNDQFDESEQSLDELKQELSAEPIYSLHYFSNILNEIISNNRHFFLTKDEAIDFVASTKSKMQYRNQDIYPLYCQNGYNNVDTKLLNSKFFKYRGYYIKKDDSNHYLVITDDNKFIDSYNTILEAMGVIDFKIESL